jgi:hypothetical protein
MHLPSAVPKEDGQSEPGEKEEKGRREDTGRRRE